MKHLLGSALWEALVLTECIKASKHLGLLLEKKVEKEPQ